MASYTPYDSKEFAPQSPESVATYRHKEVESALHKLLFNVSKLSPEPAPASQQFIQPSAEVREYEAKMARMAKPIVTPLELSESTEPATDVGLDEKEIRSKIEQALDEAA